MGNGSSRFALLLALLVAVVSLLAAAPAARAASITVNARDEHTQSPLPGIYVTLERRAASSWEYVGSATTGGGFPGSVRFDGLAAGTYLLQLRNAARTHAWCYWDQAFTRSSAREIVLGYGEAVSIHEVVWNDDDPPVTDAPDEESAARGATARITYRVRDRRPGGPTADVIIKVRTRGGKLVKTVVLPRRKVNRWLSGGVTCDLPRGTYVFTVYAVDRGGNRQRRAAHNILRVR